MTLTAAEKEHILRWSDDKEEEELTFFTYRRAWAERLLKAGAQIRRESKHEGKVVAWTLLMPASWIRIPTGNKKKGKVLSDAHKAALKAGRAKSLSNEEKGVDTDA